MAASKIHKDGLGWQVGKGDKISIINHAWIPGSIDYKLASRIINCNLELVAVLIDFESREWRKETITRVFNVADGDHILRIPLIAVPHEDEIIWRCEALGEFSVKSAYKQLHLDNATPNFNNLQTNLSTFYRKLWDVNVPSKILITVWRISYNYFTHYGKFTLKTTC